MNKLIKYVPLHFLVCLIFGIVIQYYFKIWQFNFTVLFLVLGFLVFLLFLVSKKIFATLLSYITFFFIGLTTVFCSNSKNYTTNYNNFSKENKTTILTITKGLKPGFYYEKYLANVSQIETHKTLGSILLNVQKDSTVKRLHVDDVILTKQNFKKLIPPLNPNQFNYKSYLAKQGIYNQLFLNQEQFINLPKQHTTLVGLSAKVRNKIQQALVKYNFKDDEFAVISALLLGQRQDISKGLLTDYANAGAIHILAVSGLHVGIVLLILSFVLKPIEKLKYGKFIKAFSIILLLWMFAFIAGLSASVVRAVTMFTFVAFGQVFHQKNNVYFSLITSMLFLLICKPMFLFDVGFQLSYLAVFGIVWVQPKLYALYAPRFYLDKKVWQLFTVSIGAQVGILPLSIYYFQQFPGLFVLSNLIIIPFLGFILISGILIIIGALLNCLPQFLASFYGDIIATMNAFVSWISQQEDFLLKEISISFLMMLGCYFLMFSLVLVLMKRKTSILIYFLSAILVVQSIYFIETKIRLKEDAFIVFHKSRSAILGLRTGERLLLQQNVNDQDLSKIKAIKPYTIKNNLVLKNKDFKNLLHFKKNTILLLDSLGVYQIENLPKPIVVLQYSPKINLKRLITKVKPTQIIADGSNYKNNINFWKQTCLESNIPFHYTGQKGAFILTD
ncbi:ComEC/Rec2 family competence protein [uncultured Polaribacter sp.]|uniref:ComEC/Rec2 family competence protein n=1 Tax=uncultured Polaribacter sp. TaxID=174711 RepID=UPI00261D639D|nr:ComEC/Rec2 family competence protein [uncultured Polaribacter sp.]